MELHLCCFADSKMTISRQRLVDSVANISNNIPGVNFSAHCYGDSLQNGFLQIHPSFFEQNKPIFSQPRGFGYWLWKPHIIYETLRDVPPGAWVLYADAGIELLSSVLTLTQFNQDIVLFGNEWPHVMFCKRSVWEVMLPGWYDPNQKQVQASVILVRKTTASMRFIWEWLQWCQKPGFIDDSPSPVTNDPTFKEHRHDQAILTNIAIKHKIQLHWWPSCYPDGSGHLGYQHLYAGDNYPLLFLHHRKRNEEWK